MLSKLIVHRASPTAKFTNYKDIATTSRFCAGKKTLLIDNI